MVLQKNKNLNLKLSISPCYVRMFLVVDFFDVQNNVSYSLNFTYYSDAFTELKKRVKNCNSKIIWGLQLSELK